MTTTTTTTTTTKEAEAEVLQSVECLYAGRRVLRDGKLAEAYIPVTKAKAIESDDWDDFERETSLFGEAKRSKGQPRGAAVVGGVYKMEVKLGEDGRINTAKTASREFVRRFEDRDIVVACEARDSAATLHVRSTRTMAKLKSESYLADELKGLRRLYQRTPYADRMALELVVLGALRRAA